MSKRSKREKIDRKAFKNSIIGIFTTNPKKTLNYKQISNSLLVNKSEEKSLVLELLDELRNEGTLEEPSTGKFKLKAPSGNIIGKIEITQGGYGFVTSENLDEDIFISKDNLKHALNGDLV